MSWTTPVPFVALDVLEAAQLNLMQDNLIALWNAPSVEVTHNASQVINASQTVALPFNTERYDTHAFHSTSTDTSRLTVPSGLAGKYLIVANVYATNITGTSTALVFIRKNGTTAIASQRENTYSNQNVFNVVVVADLIAGDYVECVIMTGGYTTTIDIGGHYPIFSMHRIG